MQWICVKKMLKECDDLRDMSRRVALAARLSNPQSKQVLLLLVRHKPHGRTTTVARACKLHVVVPMPALLTASTAKLTRQPANHVSTSNLCSFSVRDHLKTSALSFSASAGAESSEAPRDSLE